MYATCMFISFSMSSEKPLFGKQRTNINNARKAEHSN